jgi:hypothetical protein
VPLLALTPQPEQNPDKVRSKSVAGFSARQIVSENKGHSVYLPTLSERLDSPSRSGYGGIVETPKRVSFGFADDSTKSNAATK